ncbi:MAG: hypothetical protein J6O62_00040 [Bacilli bacterium]|nr:hypothetical protein [Bacilli bacterium]
MRVTYVADKTSLNSYKNSISSEKFGFDEGSYKYFTNGYISTCTDPVVMQMREKIANYYSTIEKGYQSLNTWLDDYIKDMDNLDESLASGTSTVTDSSTNSYLNGFVDKINEEVMESGDTIKQMDLNYDISTYTETDYDPNANEEEINLDEYITYIDELIAEYNSDIEMLESEYDQAMQTAAMNTQPIIDIEKYPDLNDMPAIKAKIDELKGDVSLMEYYKKEAQHMKEIEPYENLMDTEDFNNFLIDYDGDALYKEYYNNKNYNVDDVDLLAIIEYQKKYNTEEDFGIFQINVDDTSISLSDIYKYTNDDQKLIYHYLFKTRGRKEADKYLSLLTDDINKAKGAEDAAKWIEDFKIYYASQTDGQNIGETILGFLASYSTVSIKGIDDGVTNFNNGMYNLLVNDKHLTSDEYAACIVRTYLAENTGYYGTVYDVHSAIGNMTPAIAASAITTALFTPAVGSAVGSTLMGVSAGGNAKHQALVNGSSTKSAWIYGLFSGASEATLGYFLGKIPGISKTSGFTLANLISEGTEEFSQEWIDAGLRAVILGENIDLTQVENDSFYSFFVGVLVAGYTNAPGAVTSKINVNIDGKTYEISREEFLKVVSEEVSKNKNVDMTQLKGTLMGNSKIVSKQTGKKYNNSSVAIDYNFFKMYDGGNSTFGVNQGYLTNLKKTNPNDYNRLKNKLKNQGFSNSQVKVIMKNLDSKGACSYASVCNGIFSKYKNDPNGFKQKFGFDMYTTNSSGKLQLNQGELLLDIYLYTNDYANGGGLWYKDANDGKKYLLKITEVYDAYGNKTYQFTKTKKLYTENQQYMSSPNGFNFDIMNNYLKTKGIQQIKTANTYGHDFNNMPLSDSGMQNAINDTEKYIKMGYQVQLGILSDPQKVNNIRFISTNNTGDVSTASWKEGDGHAVHVVGTCDDGFIVSSWGNSYVVPYEDLQKGGFRLEYYDIN